MSEKKWRKLSEKKYELVTDEGTIVIDMPYGKVEKIFIEFMGNNGVIDPTTGLVQTDLLSLIISFGSVGNTVLTKYDPEGNVLEEGNCKALTPSLVPSLFEIAKDVIENFIKVISGMDGIKESPGMTESDGAGKAKAKKTPTT